MSAEPLDLLRLDEAVALLERRLGAVDALWIFGSQARGAARDDSDVDLAALFARRPDPLALLDARADLAALLGRDVDLVDLDGASPILAMQVLRHGRALRTRDPRRVHRFVARTITRYEDLRLVRRPAERILLARITNG